ncbi:MAG: DUF2470 domain-containing protein [Hyphomicrobiales bacterium]
MTSDKKKDVLRKTDAEGIALAKRMLRQATYGSLAVLETDSGHPLASRVTLATDFDGTPIILISELSNHTPALMNDPRCSLLIGEMGSGDPLAHPRITLICSAKRLDRKSDEGQRARKRFLMRHSSAGLYADFGDFHFFKLEIERANLNGGFAKAYALKAEDFILTDETLWAAFAEAEDGVVGHMNEDHQNAIAHYAKIAAPELVDSTNEASWLMTGIDPDGIDLKADDMALRVPFDDAPIKADDIRSVLVKMTKSD